MVIIIVIAIVALLGLIYVTQYNGLVKLRNKAEAAFAQIDVQLKRRADLIPNLIETVKGYAAHESSVLEAVIHARNKYATANSVEEKIDSANEISGALNKLFALGEAYPDLKANQNFLELQTALKDTEDKIAYARQFYNDDVKQYKNKIEMFPVEHRRGHGGLQADAVLRDQRIRARECEREILMSKAKRNASRRRISVGLLTLFLTAALLVALSPSAKAESSRINRMDITCWVDASGDAVITEVIDIDAYQGTEYYQVSNVRGNQQIRDLVVSENGVTFQDVGEWDVGAAEKRGRPASSRPTAGMSSASASANTGTTSLRCSTRSRIS